MVSTDAITSRPIDLRLLGPLTVTVDGVAVPTGGPRQMAVLARLMLTPGQVVSMDQLVDSVWDGDEPAQPNVAIRSYVSNLRRAIEPNRRRRAADSCLASAPPGYRLAIEPTSVDWVRFERLVDEGRVRLSSADYGAAIEKLRAANALWRGDPCSGLPESQIFLGHRDRMTKLRETAVEFLFEALLHQGEHALVVNEIEAAIAEHPLRERLTELGMVAFYRAGRQSEALGLGQKLRARLLEGLGIDPSPAIEALELKILNHDRSLDPDHRRPADPKTSPPSPFQPVDGDQTVIDLDSLDRDRPPTPIQSVGDKLRPVGRERELAALDRMGPTLNAGRSVTAIITGEQGIGKTTLAAAAAAGLVDGGVTVGWSRAMPGHAMPGTPGGPISALWPWAQIVLTLSEQFGDDVPAQTTADLGALAALGPGVTAALGLRPLPGIETIEQLRPGAEPETEPRVIPAQAEANADYVSTPGESTPGESTPGESTTGGSTPGPTGAGSGGSSGPRPTAGSAPTDSAGPAAAVEERQSGARRPAVDVGYRDRSGPAPVGLAEVMMAVTRYLEKLSRVRPVALIFEDLQWCDQSTIAVLNYATRTLDACPVGFVLTWRNLDLEHHPDSAGLRELAGLPRLIRLELRGFDGAAVSALAGVGGRSLSRRLSADIARRSGGNPLFIREILADPEIRADPDIRVDPGTNPGQAPDADRGGSRFRSDAGGRSWSTLTDAVRDRIDQLHADAGAVLSAGALFRIPFTVAGLTAVTGAERAIVRAVVQQSVRGGVLVDADAMTGSYRFRHPIVAEVLAAGLLAPEQANRHRTAAHHLLATGGPDHEVCYHLSRSPVAEDRLRAARMALDGARDNFDSTRIGEMDGFVATGVDAADSLTGALAGPRRDELGVEATVYLSWRAWVDGRRRDWLDHGRQALTGALALHTTGQAGRSSSRQKAPLISSGRLISADPLEPGRSADRLSRCAMNLIGFPQLPIGPTRVDGFPTLPPDTVDELKAVAEAMGADQPARWALQLHLGHLDWSTKPGTAVQAKSLREAQKLLTGARRRLGADGAAVVARAMVGMFSDWMDADARLEALRDTAAGQRDLGSLLFSTRHGYPALLELGRTIDAEELVESARSRAMKGGDPMQLAEARLIRIRHLLWTGQLDDAASDLDRAVADWAQLGLAEPVQFIRQRRALRLLRGLPADPLSSPDVYEGLWADRAAAPEQAIRLARLGDVRRATECLESMLEIVAVQQVSLTDHALTAMAARLLNHERAASTAYEPLTAAGDRLVVRPDGSAIFGPASLYAGLAAEVAGRGEAAGHIADAERAVQHFGGSQPSLSAIIEHVRPPSSQERS